MRSKRSWLLWLALLLPACQPQPAPPRATAANPADQAFAQQSCGSCHAVGRYGSSPRSAAPAFPVIANREGLTAETLSIWLKGAHNYPDEMDFYLGPQQADRLVAYILTLRDPHYRRPPD